jgi:hypothetical protein
MDRDRLEGDDLPQPPAHLRGGAHVAGNGELLWPRAAAVEAARWMAGSGLAIWGGEVYAPKGPFTAVMVSEWRTEPSRGADETWPAYVGRCLAQAVDAIDAQAADRAAEALYFLAYHPESGFPEEREAPPGDLTLRTVEDS